MNFVVTYREKDGSRNKIAIEAADRAGVFPILRERGISAIRVEEGKLPAKKGRSKWSIPNGLKLLLVGFALLSLVAVALTFVFNHPDAGKISKTTIEEPELSQTIEKTSPIDEKPRSDCPSGWVIGPDASWKVFWNDALADAKASGKKIFVLSTGSDWCGWCKKLKQDVFEKDEFKNYAQKKLVLLYLDSPRKPLPEDQKQHNDTIRGTLSFGGGVPCAAVFGVDSRRYGVISGYSETPAEYIARIDEVLAKKGEMPKSGQPPKIFTEGYIPSSNAVQSVKEAVSNPQGEESKANRQATAVPHVGAGLYDKDGMRLIGYPCTGCVARISAAVTNISESACKDLGYAMSIEVNPANRFYKSFEGCLYDRDMTTLIRCPNVSQMKIPEGVKCIGPHAFENLTELANVDIPSSVVEIGECAFYACLGLESVSIPQGVTNIGHKAFVSCKSLKSITIPSSVKSIGIEAFSMCWGLKAVVLMPGVESIGLQAFIRCPQLASVRIPSSVRIIGRLFNDEKKPLGCNVFWVVDERWYTSNPPRPNTPNICEELKIVVDKGDEDRVHEMLYRESLCADRSLSGLERRRKAIEERVGGRRRTIKVVAGNVLGEVQPKKSDEAQDEKLASGAEPTNVIKWTYEIVNGGVVLGGRGKTAVPEDTSGGLVIPEKIDGKPVCSIGMWAFGVCDRISSVTIPSGVTNIKSLAFCGCSGLTSVTIPSSVASIGMGAFSGCSGMTSVTIPSGVTSIECGAFSGCCGLKLVTIPASIKSIEGGAFSGCSALKSIMVDAANASYSSKNGLLCSKDGSTLVAGVNGDVSIPAGVTTIEKEAFRDFEGLTSVAIPASVTSIGEYAFCGCDGLTSITIGSGVTSIGRYAFWDCKSLASVTIPSSVTSIECGAFSCCKELATIYVDEGDGNRVKSMILSSGASVDKLKFVKKR